MKSVFGFRVRLGNPDLDFENLNPDFPIERTPSDLQMSTSKNGESINRTWLKFVSQLTLLFLVAVLKHYTLSQHILTDHILT